jgi:archaellum component FlaF (FlaF/FlaG flagellin family)
MGFGTSGSFLVIFAGLFLAVGTLYTATANVSEQLNEAGEDHRERHLTVQGTSVQISSAEWNDSASNLTVSVANDGETTLSAEHTDVVVDGAYVSVASFQRREVDGRSTDVWRPGEQLVLEDSDAVTASPERVKVVTGSGVADVAEVSVQ